MANILDYLRWRGDLHWQASPLNDVDLLILAQLSYVNFDAQLGGEGRMDQRRSLAQTCAHLLQQGPQGQAGVRHPDVELAGPQRLRHPGAQAPGGTGVQRGVDEVVAVESLPHPGQEQAARGDLPAVGAHRGDGGRLLPGIQPGAVHGGYDLRDGHWLHAVHPLLFTSQESRTISSQSCS